MLSFKRFLYLILGVAVLGSFFLISSINRDRSVGAPFQNSAAPEREFMETVQVDEGERPGVWILGDPNDARCGGIYENVRQLCADLRLTVAGEGSLDAHELKESDLVILCDSPAGRYADTEELDGFIAGGGRVILAAGLAEGDADRELWPALGILEKGAGENCRELVFENPLLPVQPEKAMYDGSSDSARIELSEDACVYIRDEETEVPILYTYDWKKGGVCVINGSFLADVRYTGFLTGAISALLPDFVYPVLGVKAVFLDNFLVFTPADDELCRRVYGYSAEGFVRDVVWPAFQGVSLRTDTPYTSGLSAVASSGEGFEKADEGLVTVIGKSVLKFGGELVYAASCAGDGKVIFNEDFITRFSADFPSYTVRGLVMETDDFSTEVLNVPGAEIRTVRGMLSSRDTRLSWEDRYAVFPGATAGNSMEDGNLLAACSVLGAYGMVSHVFDVNMMIAGAENAVWDSEKKQIGLFESEILDRVPWLEGRTLTQTGGDVKSYLAVDYGWARDGGHLELDCSGAAKGQAFFYHTDARITGAEGLTYEYAGNGYYLLRVQDSHGIITLEERK